MRRLPLGNSNCVGVCRSRHDLLRARLGLLTFSVFFLSCQSSSLPEVNLRLDAGPLLKTRAPQGQGALRVSVAAMMSPSGTFQSYGKLLDRLGAELGVGVEFVQRRTYRETNDLLSAGSLDVAFICTGGYLELELSGRHVELLAVPIVRGAMTYQSVIIVPAGSPVAKFAALAGKRFAFTDELSLSGYAWPMWLARQEGHDPLRFFSNTYFTRSHDRSVDSVAKGVVDAAAVDSVILEDMLAATPGLSGKVRILQRSEPLGMPPVVASTRLDKKTREAVRRWLVTLHEQPEGRELLDQIGLDRFEVPPPGLYDLADAIIRGEKP